MHSPAAPLGSQKLKPWSHVTKLIHFRLKIFKKANKRNLTCNKFSLSNDEPQRPIIFQWEQKEKKHTTFFFQLENKRSKSINI